jgi:hypothetical protein
MAMNVITEININVMTSAMPLCWSPRFSVSDTKNSLKAELQLDPRERSFMIRRFDERNLIGRQQGQRSGRPRAGEKHEHARPDL